MSNGLPNKRQGINKYDTTCAIEIKLDTKKIK